MRDQNAVHLTHTHSALLSLLPTPAISNTLMTGKKNTGSKMDMNWILNLGALWQRVELGPKSQKGSMRIQQYSQMLGIF
jgi:hypothetical protein